MNKIRKKNDWLWQLISGVVIYFLFCCCCCNFFCARTGLIFFFTWLHWSGLFFVDTMHQDEHWALLYFIGTPTQTKLMRNHPLDDRWIHFEKKKKKKKKAHFHLHVKKLLRLSSAFICCFLHLALQYFTATFVFLFLKKIHVKKKKMFDLQVFRCCFFTSHINMYPSCVFVHRM